VQFTRYIEYAGAVDVSAVTEEDDGLGGEDGLDVTPVTQDQPNI
jgi:hypothetical protein